MSISGAQTAIIRALFKSVDPRAPRSGPRQYKVASSAASGKTLPISSPHHPGCQTRWVTVCSVIKVILFALVNEVYHRWTNDVLANGQVRWQRRQTDVIVVKLPLTMLRNDYFKFRSIFICHNQSRTYRFLSSLTFHSSAFYRFHAT